MGRLRRKRKRAASSGLPLRCCEASRGFSPGATCGELFVVLWGAISFGNTGKTRKAVFGILWEAKAFARQAALAHGEF
jgi:hypothetical protein